MTAIHLPLDEKRGQGGRIRPLTDAQFWAQFDRKLDKASGCWVWTGSTQNHGYGQVKVPGQVRTRLAHRVSWERVNGPIPAGLLVLHRCDNPPCVNPAHLFVGTQSDNMRDAYAKGRQPQRPARVLGPTCKRGHDRAVFMRPAKRRGSYCGQCHADRERARQQRLRGAA